MVPRTTLRAVVVDPEVVFVANLMKADARALMASFQCDFSLSMEPDGAQTIKANLRELKVLACPFIYSKEDKTVTTVRGNLPPFPSLVVCNVYQTEMVCNKVYS